MKRNLNKMIMTSMLSLASVMSVTMLIPISVHASEITFLQASMGETEPTLDISTEEMRRILADDSAVIMDSRSYEQFVAGHIPGAYNIDLPPRFSDAHFAEALEPLLAKVQGDKSKPLVLYCNGPNCAASRLLGKQLVDAGFTNVKRYQLGLPVWRALGGPTVMELEGAVRIFGVDNTAVFLDVRTREEFSSGSIPGTHNVPLDEMPGIWDTATKPRNDLNSRVVLFGRDGEQARAMAEALSTSPYHNVNYYPGTYESLKAAIDVELKARVAKLD